MAEAEESTVFAELESSIPNRKFFEVDCMRSIAYARIPTIFVLCRTREDRFIVPALPLHRTVCTPHPIYSPSLTMRDFIRSSTYGYSQAFIRLPGYYIPGGHLDSAMIYEGTAILKLIDHMIDTDTAHPTSRRFAGRGYED